MPSDLTEWLWINLPKEAFNTRQQKTINLTLHRALLHEISGAQFKKIIRNSLDDKQLRRFDRNIIKLHQDLKADTNLNYYKLAFLQLLDGSKIGFSKKNLNLRVAYNLIDSHNFTPSVQIKDYNPGARNDLLHEVLPELKRYIKTFVAWKLDFLAKYNRYDRSDFEQELFITGYTKFYWLYPFRDESHIIGACKQSIHNYGINQIHYWKAAKRDRVAYDEETGGNTNRHVLMDMVVDMTQEESPEWETAGGILTPNQFDTHQSLNQLLRKLKPSQQEMVYLLASCEPPKQFLNFAEYRTNLRITDYDKFLKTLNLREIKQGLPQMSIIQRIAGDYCGLDKVERKETIERLKNDVFAVV